MDKTAEASTNRLDKMDITASKTAPATFNITELIRQGISVVMVTTGAFWLLCSFITFTLVQTASVAQTGGADSTKLNISVAVFTLLALFYTGLGLAFGNQRKMAWQQLFASSLCYLGLGLYILVMWHLLVPEFNQQLAQAGRLSAGEIETSSTLASLIIFSLLVAAPAVTLALLMLPDMRQRFAVHSVVYSGQRNLYQSTLLWHSFGLAVLLLLGAGFDPRQLNGDSQAPALAWLWAGAALAVALGGVFSGSERLALIGSGWLLNVAGLTLALIIGFRAELDWRFLLEVEWKTEQVLALSFWLFYSAAFTLYTLLNLSALWRAPRPLSP